MNYQFNIEGWLEKCPLQLRQDVFGRFGSLKHCIRDVVGPEDICEIIQLRKEANGQVVWGEPAPVDVFIMAEGESSVRSCTKLGGLPYRPNGARWLKSKRYNRPLRFIAQFDFSDSRDIYPTLPGDVLLVFSPDALEMEPLYFEWYPLGLSSLVGESDVPRAEHSFFPCYGYRYRAESFPGGHAIGSEVTVKGTGIYNVNALFRFSATQIGRTPLITQDHMITHPLPGTCLCTIHSALTQPTSSYPLINRRGPIGYDDADYKSYFSSDDGDRCIFIYMDDRGRLHHRDCYS